MRGLGALAWRDLWRRPLRTLLTAAGIALGVAVLFAAIVSRASIDGAVDRSVRDLLGSADLRVQAFTERGLTDPTIATLASTPGVAVVAPELERQTYLQTRLDATGGGVAAPVTVLGLDPALDPRLHPLHLTEGTRLTAGLERSALVSETLAAAEHLALGDQVTLLGSAAAGPTAYRVVGLLAGNGPLPDARGRVVVLPLGAARTLFDVPGVSRVDLGLAPGADPAAVTAALASRLTREPYVLSTPQDVAAALAASTAGFEAGTALLAAVALFVGAFLVFNTLSMTVAERVREVGLLRAAGATRGQVHRLVLAEAATMGLLGSLLGLVAGLGLAVVLADAVPAFGGPVVDRLAIPADGAVLALALGLAVTLAAGLEPAWRAGRLSPVEALRPGALGIGPRAARLRWLVVVFVVLGAAGLLLWPSPPGVGRGALDQLRPFAVYGLLLLVAALSPFLVGPLGRLLGLPLARALRAESRLARSALARDRSRTALTVGALTVGLAMIVAMGTVAQDARRAAADWLTTVVPGDELLGSIRPLAPDEPGLAQLAAIPGVQRVSPLATFGVDFQGRRVDAAAVHGADLLADGRLTFVAGDRTTALTALDGGGATVLPASLADRLGAHVGDTLAFATGSAPTTLRVAGIVDRSLPGPTGEALLVGWGDATSAFGVTGARFLAVRYASGQEAVGRPRLDALARSLALEPADLDALGGAVGDALGRVFGLFDLLAAVAVVIAGLGIVNTLTMSVDERVREIGMLRAAGMTRAQVWRMVVLEAGLLGAVGALLGCLGGLLVGAVILRLAAPDAAPTGLPWATAGLAFAFGLAVSLLAAAWPARLASRLSIVRAVAYE